MPLLDLYADKDKDTVNGDSIYTGRVRVAEHTSDGYVFSHHSTTVKRLTKADALVDARELAHELAELSNQKIVHETERSITTKEA